MNVPRAAGDARLWVKICGLTHPADALEAIRLGADAIGLNFYAGSKRCLSLERDAGWIGALPSTVQKIAVLVNPTRRDVDRLMALQIVDAVQLHGDEDAEFCSSLHAAGIPFIKAVRVRGAASLEGVERFHTPTVLLDAFHPGAYGGTGQPVDWSVAAAFAARPPAAIARVILSGGLTPANVAHAVRSVRPAGVDVASGVEGVLGPRRKDATRMREFLEAVGAQARPGAGWR